MTEPERMLQALQACMQGNPGRVAPAEAAEMMATLGLDADGLLKALVRVAWPLARPPVSRYHVGAAGRGVSGAIYLGANIELPGHALNQTVHAEQSVVSNAFSHDEEQLEALAVSAAPCGHCRQWLNETWQGASVRILIAEQRPLVLGELLPMSFGPTDLGVSSALLCRQAHSLALEGSPAGSTFPGSTLAAAALAAAQASYAPYSGCPSGVALRLADGQICSGRYAENAAFNPSLSPLQAALVSVALRGRAFDQIVDAVLVERREGGVSHESVTRSLLATLAPAATLEVLHPR